VHAYEGLKGYRRWEITCKLVGNYSHWVVGKSVGEAMKGVTDQGRE